MTLKNFAISARSATQATVKQLQSKSACSARRSTESQVSNDAQTKHSQSAATTAAASTAAATSTAAAAANQIYCDVISFVGACTKLKLWSTHWN